MTIHDVKDTLKDMLGLLQEDGMKKTILQTPFVDDYSSICLRFQMLIAKLRHYDMIDKFKNGPKTPLSPQG